MEKIITIRGNDEENGELITIGIEPWTDEDTGEEGYKIVADNDDDVSTSGHPQSREKCLSVS